MRKQENKKNSNWWDSVENLEPPHSAVRMAIRCHHCSKSGFCRQKRDLPDDLALRSLGAQTERTGSRFKQKLAQACVQQYTQPNDGNPDVHRPS